VLFAWAETALAAGLGRALIGAAHGVAWVSMPKLVTHWNAGVIVGTLVQMPVIGAILDANWRGIVVNGVRQYDTAGFRAGLVFLPGWLTAALLLPAAPREPRQS
jgi:hypothetical protein